jgi:hypothetical protein
MVLMVPVVLALGGLTACTNPLADDASSTPSYTPYASTTDTATTTATTSVAPGTDGEQTGEPNPSPYVTPSRTAQAGAKPTCAIVWVDGNVLPAGYDGCTGDTKAHEDSLNCNDGSTLWMRTEADTSEYYGFAGKSINHTRDPDGDASAQAKCMS